MLQNLEREINAEEELTVEPAAWKHAYAIIRCPGSCELGPHCWQDPYGKKHYKLYRDELLSLVRYVQSGIGVPQHHAQRPQHEHIPPIPCHDLCPTHDIDFISGISVHSRPNEILFFAGLKSFIKRQSKDH